MKIDGTSSSLFVQFIFFYSLLLFFLFHHLSKPEEKQNEKKKKRALHFICWYTEDYRLDQMFIYEFHTAQCFLVDFFFEFEFEFYSMK